MKVKKIANWNNVIWHLIFRKRKAFSFSNSVIYISSGKVLGQLFFKTSSNFRNPFLFSHICNSSQIIFARSLSSKVSIRTLLNNAKYHLLNGFENLCCNILNARQLTVLRVKCYWTYRKKKFSRSLDKVLT